MGSRSFTCSAVIPISDQIVEDVTNGQSDKSAGVLLVTIWELGEASGPLLIAPLSEAYGRSPAFHLANCSFILGLVFSLHSQSMQALVFTRFLTGCAVASNVLNPAIVGDLFIAEQRGSPMSLVMLTQLAGTAVGPFVAAAVARSSEWRQILRISLVLAVVCELLFLILFRETYRLPEIQSSVDEPKETSQRAQSGTESHLPKVAILSAISRPFKVLRSSLVLLMLSALGSIISAFAFTTSTSLSNILQLRYGFDATETGSIFLAFSGLHHYI
jgi:MFS family permease